MNIEKIEELNTSNEPKDSNIVSLDSPMVETQISLSNKQEFLIKFRNFVKGLSQSLLCLFQNSVFGFFLLNCILLLLLKLNLLSNEIYVITWILLSMWFLCYKGNQLYRSRRRALLYRLFASNRSSNLNIYPNFTLGSDIENQENIVDVLPRINNPNSLPNLPRQFNNNPRRLNIMVERLINMHETLNRLRERENQIGRFNFRNINEFLLLNLMFSNNNNNNNERNEQNNGFTDEEISNLPSYNYCKKVDEEEVQCSICLMEFKDGEEIKTLPCIHNFHGNCISLWLKRQKYCPLCKGIIVFN